MILKKHLDFYEKVIWSNEMSAGVELKIPVICFSFLAHNPLCKENEIFVINC